MSDFWQHAAGWAGQTALAGGLVFAAAWAWLRAEARPARRQRVAGWAVRGGVLAAVVGLLPAWLTVTVPGWVAAAAEVAKPEGVAAAPVAATPAAGEEAPAAAEGPRWYVVMVPGDEAGEAGGGFEPRAVWESQPLPNPSPERGGASASTLAPTSLSGKGVGGLGYAIPHANTLHPSGREPDAVTAPPRPAVVRVLAAGYAAVVLSLLVRLAVGQAGLLRLRRSGTPAPARVRAIADELAGGMRRRPAVLVTDRVASPVCFGLFRPAVLLPRRLANAATGNELRWVLAHEFDHLRRGDPWDGWWAAVARAVYFFLPPFWAVRRELGLAQEYLADAAAAAVGRADEYAAFLVALSGGAAGGRRARTPAGAAGVRAGKSDLYRRITMLLQPSERVEPRAPRRWSAAVAGLFAGGALAVSGVAVVPASADDAPKVAERRADGDKPAPREGDRPRDGEKPRADRPRDGEKPPVGDKPREGEKPRADRPRDGEKPRADRPRDGDQPKPAVRDGDVRKPGPRDGDKPAVTAERGVDFAQMKRSLPAELAELRRAVDEAAKKGENVDEIRRRLDAVEQAFGANPIVRVTKPLPPGVPPPPAPPGGRRLLVDPVGPVGPDADRLLEQVEREMDRALEGLKGAGREEAEKAMAKARKAMEDALKNRGGNRLFVFGPDGKPLNFDMDFRMLPGGLELRGPGIELNRPAERKGRFGVAIERVPPLLLDQLDLPAGRGVVVADVTPGSPAEKAGGRANDILIEFAGQPVSDDPAEVVRQVSSAKSGEKTPVVVLRKGKKEVLQAELPKGDPKPAKAREDA